MRYALIGARARTGDEALHVRHLKRDVERVRRCLVLDLRRPSNQDRSDQSHTMASVSWPMMPFAVSDTRLCTYTAWLPRTQQNSAHLAKHEAAHVGRRLDFHCRNDML